MEDGWRVESKAAEGASEVPELKLTGREGVVFEVLRQDAALQMDEIIELVEAQLSSAEVFTALFELELAGRIRSLPGKNYVRSF
jgi:DNA processing protein